MTVNNTTNQTAQEIAKAIREERRQQKEAIREQKRQQQEALKAIKARHRKVMRLVTSNETTIVKNDITQELVIIYQNVQRNLEITGWLIEDKTMDRWLSKIEIGKVNDYDNADGVFFTSSTQKAYKVFDLDAYNEASEWLEETIAEQAGF